MVENKVLGGKNDIPQGKTNIFSIKRAHRDAPLQEITIRKYENPENQHPREVARRFLLSVGLLQPGDSRDIISDIFIMLLVARKSRKYIQVDDLILKLKDKPGASAPNIRRQLRRLREMKLVEKADGGYRITEFGPISKIVNNYIVPFVVNQTIERLREYSEHLD